MRKLSVNEEQEIQLDIFKILLSVCEKENIMYYAAYGTLLGAVREKGFIGWDDDIDIWMTRKEVNRLISVLPNYLGNKYFLQTIDSDKGFIIPEIVRICVNETYKWPTGCEEEKFHTGIYLDIFPLDDGFGGNIDIKNLQKAKKIHSRLWKTLFCFSKKSFFRFRVINQVIRSAESKRMKKLIESYSHNVSDEYVSLATAYYGNNMCIFKKEFFDKVIYLPFEGMEIACPRGYSDLLTQMYGSDYMIPKKTKNTTTYAYLKEV